MARQLVRGMGVSNWAAFGAEAACPMDAPAAATTYLARPGVLAVHCADVMALGFDTVVIRDTVTEAAAHPTAAPSA